MNAYLVQKIIGGRCRQMEVEANTLYEAAQKAAQTWKLKYTSGISATLVSVDGTRVAIDTTTLGS